MYPCVTTQGKQLRYYLTSTWLAHELIPFFTHYLTLISSRYRFLKLSGLVYLLILATLVHERNAVQ